jgi:hypothetical protein
MDQLLYINGALHIMLRTTNRNTRSRQREPPPPIINHAHLARLPPRLRGGRRSRPALGSGGQRPHRRHQSRPRRTLAVSPQLPVVVVPLHPWPAAAAVAPALQQRQPRVVAGAASPAPGPDAAGAAARRVRHAAGRDDAVRRLPHQHERHSSARRVLRRAQGRRQGRARLHVPRRQPRLQQAAAGAHAAPANDDAAARVRRQHAVRHASPVYQ